MLTMTRMASIVCEGIGYSTESLPGGLFIAVNLCPGISPRASVALKSGGCDATLVGAQLLRSHASETVVSVLLMYAASALVQST